MGEIKDFNEARRARASSERRFTLGPYTFKRRPAIPAEVLSRYANAGNDGDDGNAILAFERTLLDLVEKEATRTATGEKITTEAAWEDMRLVGDENDVISFEDLTAITEWLIAGVTERPTGQPSDSPDGSEIPSSGTTSMGISPSAESTSKISMPDAPSTPFIAS